MIRFILNKELIETDAPHGMTLLDFVRYEQDLKAVKIGCREGDCGACTMLVGNISGDAVRYRSVTSCITPIVNLHGKHVVSLEGLNMEDLSPIQKAMVDNSGTQCGFCTPGFVVSLTGFCMSEKPVDMEHAIDSIDGNICRCTGYMSIERATAQIVHSLSSKDLSSPVAWAADHHYIPAYFSSIYSRLKEIAEPDFAGDVIVGGGTDLYVQKHDYMEEQKAVRPVARNHAGNWVELSEGICTISGSAVVSDLMESVEFSSLFKNLKKHLKLVSSTPVRNLGTIAGNFVNASPIGDLTVFFLALGTSVVLRNQQGEERVVLLQDFYKGYKVLDKTADEIVVRLFFNVPHHNTLFNFEKVCKRQYLDIASVNTACMVVLEGADTISEVKISAGGVGPTPRVLHHVCQSMAGKKLSAATIREALKDLVHDISPMSDVRGSADYKSLLLEQLIKAHFIEMFPSLIKAEELV